MLSTRRRPLWNFAKVSWQLYIVDCGGAAGALLPNMCHMNYYVTTNKLQLNYSVRLLWARLVVHSNPHSNYSHFKFPLQCQENKLLLHWWISLHSSRKLERPGQGRGWPGQKVGSYAFKLLKCTVISSVPSVFTITEKAPTRAFSWLKAPTSAFTFKTLLRHYTKRMLTPW